MHRMIFAALLWLLPAAALAQSVPAQVDWQNPPPPLAQVHGPQADIADNFNVADFIEPGYPHTDNEEIASGEGAFRAVCFPTHHAYNDSIVKPGQPGMNDHYHAVFGNPLGDVITAYSDLRTSGLSSCFNKLWRSAYWLPAMVVWNADGSSHTITPDVVIIYYKRPGINMPQCQPTSAAYIGRCVPLPNGLKGIAGYDMLTGTQPSGKTSFSCIVYTTQMPGGHVGQSQKDIPTAASTCPAVPSGETLVKRVLNLKVEFPPCWNGTDLDSPNHRSHLADYVYNPATGRAACPATHPYAFWRYTAQFQWIMDASLPTDGLWWVNRPGWYLDSDRRYGKPQLKPGTTFHFDLFDGMSPYMKVRIEANCINRVLSCFDADLGNGEKLKRLWLSTNLTRVQPRPAASREPASVKLSHH